jgi:hypothetical protein
LETYTGLREMYIEVRDTYAEVLETSLEVLETSLEVLETSLELQREFGRVGLYEKDLEKLSEDIELHGFRRRAVTESILVLIEICF